jgi:dTDP-4-amino-4,6-dideoxygalactose transaminase
MALPFFSIHLKLKDYIDIIINLIFPFNKKKLEIKLIQILSTRYPNKYISILPSGRLGFYLTLKELFKPNDLIAFSSMSFPLYVKIAKQLNLKVKLIDIDKKDLNINVEYVKNLDENCKGLVVTHLFGNPCDIKEIKDICNKKNIILIEDCAQSFDSKYNGIETGNFGDAAVVSLSLLKIPTTLSGGILITSHKLLHSKTEDWITNNLSNNFFLKLKLFFKILIFILNSYPKIYSILSDKIFFFLKKNNPRIYRKILYSGMGMKNLPFDPKERPKLSKFQLKIGINQIKDSLDMKIIRRKHSRYLQARLEKSKKIKIINNHYKGDWNHQYFVIFIKENFNNVYNNLFKKGIHVMDENVWDCSEYNFELENKFSEFENTKKFNKGLLRIQNNSFLNIKQIEHIADVILDSVNG